MVRARLLTFRVAVPEPRLRGFCLVSPAIHRRVVAPLSYCFFQPRSRGFFDLRRALALLYQPKTKLQNARLGVRIIFMALLGLSGCGSNSPPVEIQPQSGLERAKGILNDYASGVPLGSEAATFEEVVAEVRKTDQQKATILEKGFADLKRSPQNLRDKARALLKQL